MSSLARRFNSSLVLLIVLSFVLPLSAMAAAVPTTPQQDPVVVTAARNANLRAGPGTDYAIVGGVKAGAPLDVVAQNTDGTWYKLADGSWIFAQLVTGRPVVPVETATDRTTPAATPAAPTLPAPLTASATGWTLVAESSVNFPGGRERNHWYYLFTEGRNSFSWKEMTRPENEGCFRDTASLGLEICGDQITTNAKGDVAIQWKASKGGTYRLEWDSASLKFYQHSKFVGILETGSTLPFAATFKDVIEWEMFFWVAADSTAYQIRIYRLDDVPVNTQAAAAPTEVPAQQALATFGAGMKRVGADIQAGTYRAPGGSFCYWERLNGFAGRLGNIIANEIGAGPQIVTIAASDKGFNSRGCGQWTLDLSPIRLDAAAPFTDGVYFVGKDVAPGVWQASGSDGCYWETLSGFSGEFRDLHENDFLNGSTIVEIRAEDTGFRAQGCGTWTKIE